MDETILKQCLANAIQYIIDISETDLTRTEIIDIMTYDIGFQDTLEAENFAFDYGLFGSSDFE